MRHLYFYLVMMAAVMAAPCSFALELTGTVTDHTGVPVVSARIRFTNVGNPARSITVDTDAAGRYVVDGTTAVEVPQEAVTQLFCYPNPFNRQTVVSFYLDRKQRIELAVYSMDGRKIRTVSSGDYQQGHHQLVWDGLTQRGAPALPGMYICSLQGESLRASVKMLVQGGDNVAVPVWQQEKDHDSKAMKLTETATQIYNIDIWGDGFTAHRAAGVDLTGLSVKDFVINRSVWTPFSTTDNYLGVYNGENYTPVFIKGINLGAAVPGSLPGQLAISSDQYARWFKMMADAGFNTLRIYTLHYPRFYEEFARYNTEHPDKPLYLLHGVWLVEEYPSAGAQDDLYSLTEKFDEAVRETVDCIHGNATIGHRYGQAYGTYRTDVSPWVLGFILGREIHAVEVGMTNLIHSDVTSWTGSHVSISGVSPTEAWATERIDRLIAAERLAYGTTRPSAWSSWPTLDPLVHPSEEYGSDEDGEQIDLNTMRLMDAPGGYFASYHAYPYYPNFINWDDKYQGVNDAEGINNYLAYLHDLRAHYTNFPLLITEFGVPSSYGNARFSHSGMNHGGMTEEEQGNFNMRMLHNIYDANCGGGIMFSWMDEWFKRTWITHPMTSDMRHLWHNLCSPENNFGLLSFTPNPQYYTARKTTTLQSTKVSKAEMWHDFASLNVETTLKTPLAAGDTLWVAIDTYKPGTGESTLPNKQKLIWNRAEFLLRITPDSANLYITQAYNLLGLVFRLCEATSFQTQTTDGAPWRLFQWQNGTEWEGRESLPHIQDIGKLSVCFGNAVPASHQAVQIRSDGILIRIPWGLLHFSEPSSAKVVDDAVSVDLCKQKWACGMQYLTTTKTDGINISMIYKGEVAELASYMWSDWGVNSEEILNPDMFIETEKTSLPIIREGLRNAPFTPK